MEHTTLGPLDVSVVGLGCGGPSRLGQSAGQPSEESERVVRRALELGITLFDTAEVYGTEEILGRALSGRDDVVVSTKAYCVIDDRMATGAELREKLDASLRRLGRDHVDIYHLHAILPDQYPHARDELLPTLEALKDEGKIRCAAISEAFIPDPGHETLSKAVEDRWDVMMAGFNLLNPSARDRVFPKTRERGIGTLVMFAVRRALSRPDKLQDALATLVGDGLVPADAFDPADPLGDLVRKSGARDVTDLAYRFARHTPGVDVVLTGTGNVEHLEQNVASILGPPLPDEVGAELADLFGHIDHISAN